MIINDVTEPDLTYRILRLAAGHGFQDKLYWEIGPDDQLRFCIDGSAWFGKPDPSGPRLLVFITEDNFFLLVDAYARVHKLTDDPSLWHYALVLYTSRVLCRQPSAHAYPLDFTALWPWLDICGKARHLTCLDEPLKEQP